MGQTPARDDISDARQAREVHRAPFVDGIRHPTMTIAKERELTPERREALIAQLEKAHIEASLAAEEERARKRLLKRTFERTTLKLTPSGIRVCGRCETAPYFCYACSGWKCRCYMKKAGVYRHWETGKEGPGLVPIMLAYEADVLCK